MNKFTFFLMSHKGFHTLKSFIIEFGSEFIDFVVASKDNNVINDYYDDIAELCENNRIQFYNRQENYEVTSEFAYAISWKWLINLGNSKLIVFHDSLLPKYRGFAPLITALINSDKVIGVTALFASAEYDKGNIIAQNSLMVDYPIKINDAINLISGCYVNLIISITKDVLSSNKIVSTPQDNEDASYSLWLDEKDYFINWGNDAEYIKRFIDSVGFPYKGAVTIMESKRARILDAEIVPDVKVAIRQCGKVIFSNQDKPVVVCGTGLLQINEMIDDQDNSKLLPLKKFRTRFE